MPRSDVPTVVIVGAGLTGCTVAHALAQQGVRSVLYERSAVPGGLIRSAHLNGVLYEPHGSHVFHTDDEEIWDLANGLVPFNAYRHRVDIVINGEVLNWPILLGDIRRQADGDVILRELSEREGIDLAARARAANFEEWCLALMGPTLYERYVRPYTQKQWGCPPAALPAHWAPRRISVRSDDDPYLFTDRHQGWPAGRNGYTDLIDALLDSPLIELQPASAVRLEDIEALVERCAAGATVLTCPLDELCAGALGPLGWRGIAVHAMFIPGVALAQGAMVVNYPSLVYPFIRIHETKHASGQQCDGTVLGIEFTGAPARHYPVPTAENAALNGRYQALIRERLKGRPVFFAGRLANFAYLDMDECMRQAVDRAAEVLLALSPCPASCAAARRAGGRA